MKHCIFVVTVILLKTSAVFSQQVHKQQLYWLRYQNQIQFSPAIYWNNEIDNRRFINPDVQHQLIFHSRLHYKTGRWDLGGGVTYSLGYSGIPENGYQKPLGEIRPVVEASHDQPIKKISFQNRIRIDNRFFQEERETSVFEASDYILRFRYRLQVRVPLKQEGDITTISIRAGDEIMFNSKKNFFDQNRIYVTGEFYINRNLILEAGYLYIDQQRLGRDDFFSRHVYRFSFNHKVFHHSLKR